jgi:hypothetical protein
MNAGLYRQYQNHVLRWDEIVYYDQILMNGKYRDAIKREPMIGIKVLLKDTRAYSAQSPAHRIQYINTGLMSVLDGTGCILRESKSVIMPDGFWLISFPVPRSQLSLQVNQIINTIIKFGNYLGFACMGLLEIYISGRANKYDLMDRLSRIELPQPYRSNLIKPESNNGLVSYGSMYPIVINNYYSMIRSRWVIDPNSQSGGLKDTIENVSLRLSSAFY